MVLDDIKGRGTNSQAHSDVAKARDTFFKLLAKIYTHVCSDLLLYVENVGGGTISCFI